MLDFKDSAVRVVVMLSMKHFFVAFGPEVELDVS